ncbi:MAG: hypothetical protein JSU00_24995 [Acidobacteria bacterium]|nr:hypothetical protein [Acidobacteriota bacterium]
MGLLQSLAVTATVCVSALAAAGPASVDTLIEAGHWKRARAEVQAQLKANPSDAQAHAWLGKIDTAFGDLDSAIREAERAIELDGRNANYHGLLAEACALSADRSSIIKGLQFVRRMKKEVDVSLAIDPRNVDTMLLEMMFSYKAPSIAGGDKQKARRLAEQVTAISPAWGYLGQARLYQLQGEAGPVVETVLKKAVQADPGFYRARASLAQFYCGETSCPSPGQAERAALEAVAVDPNAGAAYVVLARSYVALKRWGDLESTVSRAEKANPDDLTPYYAAARRLIEEGQDFDRAERFLRHYLSQPTEGREPTIAEARRLLADMYQRSGRRNEALHELQLALQSQPDYELAKKDLNRLRKF